MTGLHEDEHYECIVRISIDEQKKTNDSTFVKHNT